MEKLFHLDAGKVNAIHEQFPLAHHEGSPHGIKHWSRVSRNAQFLLPRIGLSPVGVETYLPYVKLFALFHDCRRNTDGECLEHGEWAREYVTEKWMHVFSDLPLGLPGAMATLDAIEDHTGCGPLPDMTVTRFSYPPMLMLGVMLDADRLDLRRVGIQPDSRLLFTPVARSIADSRNFAELDSFEV